MLSMLINKCQLSFLPAASFPLGQPAWWHTTSCPWHHSIASPKQPSQTSHTEPDSPTTDIHCCHPTAWIVPHTLTVTQLSFCTHHGAGTHLAHPSSLTEKAAGHKILLGTALILLWNWWQICPNHHERTCGKQLCLLSAPRAHLILITRCLQPQYSQGPTIQKIHLCFFYLSVSGYSHSFLNQVRIYINSCRRIAKWTISKLLYQKLLETEAKYFRF